MTKKLSVNYGTSDPVDFSKLIALEPVQKQIERAKNADDYTDSYAFVYIPFDVNYHKEIIQLADKKKLLCCSICVVVGIGGSCLGTQAVHLAINGTYWNELHNPKIYWADTLDSQESFALIQILERCLKVGERVLLVVISKSGTTLETLVQFAVFRDLIQRYYPKNYREFIVIITDKNSNLADYARDNNCDLLTIPEPIGGRYSVFTAVGSFVLAYLGGDIEQFQCGARAALKDSLSMSVEINNAARSALFLYGEYQRGNSIADYFVFPKMFFGIGMWYRQLLGESLGKQARDGAFCHLVPTVSVGSNDLHAVAQLYLGGNPPIVTQFLTCQKYLSDVVVSSASADLVNATSYSVLMHVLFQATRNAYDEQKRPYLHIELPECSWYYIGYLVQFHMIQTVYLATFFDVDPFDQPHVELYKKHVRNLVA